MKPKQEKIEILKQMIEAAEANLIGAKQLLAEIEGGATSGTSLHQNYKSMALNSGVMRDSGKIIEGIFDGEKMIGPDGKEYAVSANYASKSKLVAGDKLKLTISDDGSFLYKQIGPAERINMVGTLSTDNGNFKVISGLKVFSVLYASVSYFKAKAGDKVTIIVPKDMETEWAAIENVLPNELPIDNRHVIPQT